MRSEEEMQEQMDKAQESISQGVSKWPGMTYEQGVRATLDWVTEGDDVAPMEEDE